MEVNLSYLGQADIYHSLQAIPVPVALMHVAESLLNPVIQFDIL